MQATTIEHTPAGDDALAERVLDSLNHHRIPSLSRVRVVVNRNTIVLGGEVNSFYARQLLLTAAMRVAGVRQIVDEVNVVIPAAFRDPLRLRRAAAAGAVLLMLVLVSGCGKAEAERVAVHPVAGQVLYNGKPAAGAYVVFHPKQAAAGFPVPRGHADAKGDFVLSTYSAQDGAPAGEYSVTVVLEQMVKKGEDFERGPNVLPAKFAKPTTTSLVARVAEGQNSVPIKIVR